MNGTDGLLWNSDLLYPPASSDHTFSLTQLVRDWKGAASGYRNAVRRVAARLSRISHRLGAGIPRRVSTRRG